MPDDANPRVTCPGCDKGYRWQALLVGRAVPCKRCGAAFTVPDAPGRGLPIEPMGDDGTYELDIDESNETRQLATPAVAGKCPNCNSPVKEHAVICINCGFNMEHGEVMAKPRVAELAPDERKASEKQAKAPLRGMSLVRVGLWLNLLAIVAGIVAIPFAVFDSGPAAIVGGLLLIGSGLAALVGTALCLGAPKESGARPIAIVSVALSLVSVVGVVAHEIGSTPDALLIASNLVGEVGTGCFLYFFVMLAKYLEFPEVIERAEKVFGLFLLVTVGQYLLLIPLLGCFIALLVLGAAIYFAVLYVLLLIDLSNALSYRIGEQKAEHAY
ncbi:MAG: hypothetical protein ACE37H_09355 [Phycisphaeraceae bacterium]